MKYKRSLRSSQKDKLFMVIEKIIHDLQRNVVWKVEAPSTDTYMLHAKLLFKKKTYAYDKLDDIRTDYWHVGTRYF